jgi:hypothetical protein
VQGDLDKNKTQNKRQSRTQTLPPNAIVCCCPPPNHQHAPSGIPDIFAETMQVRLLKDSLDKGGNNKRGEEKTP